MEKSRDQWRKCAMKDSPQEQSKVSTPTLNPKKPRTTLRETLFVQLSESEKAKETLVSPNQVNAAKAKPKLNMGPSVMKRTVHVKPGHTKEASESCHFAFSKMSPFSRSEIHGFQSSPCSSSSSSADVVSEFKIHLELQPITQCKEVLKVPIYKQSLALPPNANISSLTKSLNVPQSSLTEVSIQNKTCLLSMLSATVPDASSSSTQTEYDFDELMKEFIGYYHEFGLELDPTKSFDDLLQELFEVIASDS